jgi:lipoate-protein ligase A
MALDEAILDAAAKGVSPPTLRLYAWEPACLSLGYAQPFGDVDHHRLQASGWDLVRRSSGGRAILHSDELTYALIAPASNPHFAGGLLDSYRHFSRGLAAALSLLGLEPEVHAEAEDDSERNPSPVCFQIPGAYEITVQGKKLIGSAQVRRRGGILQHGSLPLKGDITRVCQVLAFASEGQREQAVALLQTTASTAADLLGNPPTWLHAAQAIAEGFSSSLGIEFDRGDISSEEEQRAEELVASRFANQEWLARV